MSTGPFRHDELFPQGVRLHVIDIFLPELANATKGQISEDALFALVEPFAAMLAHSRLNALTSRVESGVFNALLYEYNKENAIRTGEEISEESVFLPVNLPRFATMFADLAHNPTTVQKKRRVMYNLKRLFELSNSDDKKRKESQTEVEQPSKKQKIESKKNASKQKQTNQESSSTQHKEKSKKKKKNTKVQLKQPARVEVEEPVEEPIETLSEPADVPDVPTEEPVVVKKKTTKLQRKPTPGVLLKASKPKQTTSVSNDAISPLEVELTPQLHRRTRVIPAPVETPKPAIPTATKSPKSATKPTAKQTTTTPTASPAQQQKEEKKKSEGAATTPVTSGKKTTKTSPSATPKRVSFTKTNSIREFNKEKKLSDSAEWKSALASSPKSGLLKTSPNRANNKK